MGQINNYPVGSANATDKILTTDVNTGQTKNVTPEGIVSYLGSKYYRAILNTPKESLSIDVNVLGTNTIGDIVWEKSTNTSVKSEALYNSTITTQDITKELVNNTDTSAIVPDTTAIISSFIGVYTGTLIGGFFGNVMFNMCTPDDSFITFSIVKNSDDQITLSTFYEGIASDNILSNQGIEIRVYN